MNETTVEKNIIANDNFKLRTQKIFLHFQERAILDMAIC
jgi:hypothetical protein